MAFRYNVYQKTHLEAYKVMAKKKRDRSWVRLVSTESNHVYYTEKNKRNDTGRMEIKKYDPTLRRHVVYRESK